VIADLQKRLAALERKAAEQETKAPSAEKYSVTAQQAAQELAKPVGSGVPPYPHGIPWRLQRIFGRLCQGRGE